MMIAGAVPGKLRRSNSPIQDAPEEIRCDACDGRGWPAAAKPSPMRRIYPGPCKKCGGKGRIRQRD
jgi:DnaJ-class molecular chaperone